MGARSVEHLLHDARSYAQWQLDANMDSAALDTATTVDELRANDVYTVVTPDECVALVRAHGSLALHPLCGGIPPEIAWQSLELVAAQVHAATRRLSRFARWCAAPRARAYPRAHAAGAFRPRIQVDRRDRLRVRDVHGHHGHDDRVRRDAHARPRIPRHHRPRSSGSCSATCLSLAIWIPASGWIGDRIGTKKVFLFALAMFTLASALCGQAHSLHELVAFRVLQGVGGGMLTPVGTAMLFRAFPPIERAKASTVLIIPTVLAPALGPIVGGWLVTDVSWRWIFYVNLPVGVFGFVLGALYLREHREGTAGRVRPPGLRALRRRARARAVRALGRPGEGLGVGRGAGDRHPRRRCCSRCWSWSRRASSRRCSRCACTASACSATRTSCSR